MNRLLLSALLLLAHQLPAAEPSAEQRADQLVGQKSYEKALEIYRTIRPSSPEQERTLNYKVANAEWRSAAASSDADDTRTQAAVKALKEIATGEAHDLIRAEADESLGDFYWTRPNRRDWGQAWPYYQKALDYWAGQSDLDTARKRYLHIVWSATRESEPGSYYGYHGNYLPVEVLENALKIAKNNEDLARAHYLLAMSLRYQGGDARQQKRIPDEFEAALKLGKKTDWYDDALYHFAQSLEQQGRIDFHEGSPRWQPDFIGALKLYKRIIKEFNKGETRYYDEATQRIKQITDPALYINVPYVYLPDSDIQASVTWRNVKKISFAVVPVDLVAKFPSESTDMPDDKYLEWLESRAGKAVKKWTKETEDDGKHVQRSDTLKLDALPPGAYLLTASGDGARARQLLLITSMVLTVKTTPTQMLFFVCDAVSGKPIAGARIKARYRYYGGKDGNEHWDEAEGKSGSNGFWTLEQPKNNYHELVAVSALSDQQALLRAYRSFHDPQNEPYRVYAFTDRPAYRPNELVQWKAIVRGYDGRIYSTPKEQWIRYEIFDALGNKIKEDQKQLDEFGGANDSLSLDEKAPLGEYRVNFYSWNPATKSTEQHIGDAVLFRLEEYKLPEFKVTISTKQKAYRMGDRVSVELAAGYYFGGAVAKAKVEYVIKQAPYYPIYFPRRTYPWYYESRSRLHPSYYGEGSLMERGQTETDADGKANFTFQTPFGGTQDFNYTIEARVVDSSRREITARQQIKVTRQGYYVHLTPQQYVYQPQDTVKVDFKSLDANDDPVSVDGTITIYRDYWETRYENEKAPAAQRKVVFEGYRNEKILSETLKTNAQGDALFTFKPEREGYYRVEWLSTDKDGVPIRSQTTVFVCTKKSRDIGYRYGGIQIIPDRDTYRAGDTARIMLVAPSHDSYAVFSVDGDDIYSYELVHFDGTVKLIDLPIQPVHEPNVFLNVFMVRDAQLFIDQKEIIVPPVEKFLTVKITNSKEQFEPREEAEMDLLVLNDKDEPIRAELAIGVVDESVYYIQQDYAGDIREFFYGRKRQPVLRTQSALQMRPYFKGKWNEEQNRFDADDMFADRRGRGYAGGLLKSKHAAYREDFDQQRDEVSRMVGGKAQFAATEAPAAPAESRLGANKEEMKGTGGAGANQPLTAPAVVVRSDFRSTVLWQPSVRTDENGKARVKLKYPDSLTAWKTTVRAVSAGPDVGMADAITRTKKDVLVRLEAPRFLVEKDRVTLSGIIHNYTPETLSLEVALQAENLKLLDETKRRIKVKPNGEQRVDWKAEAAAVGTAKLTLSAVSGKHSDAMEISIPLYEHGIEKFIAESGWSDPDQSETDFALALPKQRNPAGTRLEVVLTPSIAVTCLDALPYLADYPYGCTEQTMSRFLPAAIVARTLEDLKLSRKAVETRLFGGIEPEFAGKTHPDGKKDLKKLDRMIRDGLDRLKDMQHSDGGWGWWKQGDSDHFMTAYVVQGLILAKQAGAPVRDGMIRRGLDYLSKEIVEEERNYDMQAWMAYALALGKKHEGFAVDRTFQKQMENLWKNRDRLNAYTRSLLALAFDAIGNPANAKIVVENLENGVRADEAAQTAHWGEDGIYYRWSDGGVEATAWALKAMLAVDPNNKRIPQAMNWLVKNRRGAQWSNTRNTAMVVLALTDYLRQTKELDQNFEYELLVNGSSVAKEKITPKNALDARSRFEIPEKVLRDGDNRIQIRKKGQGKLYHAAYLTYFTKEDPVTAAGNEIFIKREYFRYVGRPTLLKGYVYDKVPLKDGGFVKSGERVEVKLTIEAKNHYEYLVFEDLKPAGLEAVQVRSGEPLHATEIKAGMYRKDGKEEATGRQSSIHQELRDRKVALFLTKLPEGIHTITYDLRAEIPGEFHALPALGHAMYVPEIRCNSDELRVNVLDQ